MKIIETNKNQWIWCLLFIPLFLTECRKKGAEIQVADKCIPVAISGRLTHDAATDTYNFRTTGGGRIRMELGANISFRVVSISHDDYPGFKIELWGDTAVNGVNKTSANHESLNGKHIKDRVGNRRTIVFPDGAKITLIANGNKGPLNSLTIYDGAESHRINPACNTLINSSTNQVITRQLDNDEPDGETAGFEINANGLLFFHMYTEDAIGNKTGSGFNLGEIFRDRPNQVNDYYDDPKLGAT